MEPNDVVEHLLKSAEWTASRSSGPGGQHRDKASTRAELTLTREALSGLPEDVADRLVAVLGVDERPLRIAVQDERSLARNQELALERLRALVAEAMAPPPPPRRATRPTRASRRRRLEQKVRRGRDKVLRRNPDDSD